MAMGSTDFAITENPRSGPMLAVDRIGKRCLSLAIPDDTTIKGQQLWQVEALSLGRRDGALVVWRVWRNTGSQRTICGAGQEALAWTNGRRKCGVIAWRLISATHREEVLNDVLRNCARMAVVCLEM